MAGEPTRPAPDEVEAGLHPALTPFLEGHAAAEATLAHAAAEGPLHHAWLIAGPRGIGKATLAYRFARTLLAGPDAAEVSLFGDAAPAGLHGQPDDPLFQQVAQASHPNLMVLRRGWNFDGSRYYTAIRVDDVRRLAGFFGQRAALRGRRVVVVDAADEMTREAANALLKPLEEPPAATVVILVCHSPGALLATIRSRCRRLTLRPPTLEEGERVLGRLKPELPAETRRLMLALADRSPGRALKLHAAGGEALHASLMSALRDLPQMERGAAQRIGDLTADRSQGEVHFELICDLLDGLLKRVVRAGGGAGDALEDLPEAERSLVRRLAAGGLDQWFEVWDNLARLRERTEAVNLNRKAVILSILSEFETAARRGGPGVEAR